MTTLRLRPEDTADTGAVRRVLAAAFARPDVAIPPEVRLVDELRGSDAWLPELAMVAEYGGEIVGYALFTRVTVSAPGQVAPALALGPVAVAPTVSGSASAGQSCRPASKPPQNSGNGWSWCSATRATTGASDSAGPTGWA